jgi:predicted ester cyclase
MSIEEGRILVMRYYREVLNGRRVELLGEIMSPLFQSHRCDYSVGIEGYAEAIRASHAAFPDLDLRVEAQVAEGDLVATRWRATGSYGGGKAGLPGDGRRVVMTGMHFHRIQGGCLVEHWEEIDPSRLAEQLKARA